MAANLDYEAYLEASIQPQLKSQESSGLKKFDWSQGHDDDGLWSEGRQLDKIQVPRSTGDQGSSKVSFPQ